MRKQGCREVKDLDRVCSANGWQMRNMNSELVAFLGYQIALLEISFSVLKALFKISKLLDSFLYVG